MLRIKSNIKYLAAALIILSIGLILAIPMSSITKPSTNQLKSQKTSNSKVSSVKTSDESKTEDENPSQPETNDQQFKDGQQAKLIRVIDGDTVEIEGGQKVRYIGIDTPETVDPRKPVQCFGTQAAAKNRELVEGKTVTLEKDVSETDKYGRLLRYVYLSDPELLSGQIFINDYLVREGYAHASSYPPDIKYQTQFTQAQQEAQQNNRGLWSACQNGQPVQNQPSTDCVIKGNISSSGEKIYHLSGQKYYNQTVIDQSRQERWFCTEEEAISAGWRKSKI